MKPLVSIIMGSTSDYPVMEKAAKFFEEMEIPFEINALSAHRTPDEVEKFAKNAKSKGIKVIIAGAGMAAHLPHQPGCCKAVLVHGCPGAAICLGAEVCVCSQLLQSTFLALMVSAWAPKQLSTVGITIN